MTDGGAVVRSSRLATRELTPLQRRAHLLKSYKRAVVHPSYLICEASGTRPVTCAFIPVTPDATQRDSERLEERWWWARRGAGGTHRRGVQGKHQGIQQMCNTTPPCKSSNERHTDAQTHADTLSCSPMTLIVPSLLLSPRGQSYRARSPVRLDGLTDAACRQGSGLLITEVAVSDHDQVHKAENYCIHQSDKTEHFSRASEANGC